MHELEKPIIFFSISSSSILNFTWHLDDLDYVRIASSSQKCVQFQLRDSRPVGPLSAQ